MAVDGQPYDLGHTNVSEFRYTYWNIFCVLQNWSVYVKSWWERAIEMRCIPWLSFYLICSSDDNDDDNDDDDNDEDDDMMATMTMITKLGFCISSYN